MKSRTFILTTVCVIAAAAVIFVAVSTRGFGLIKPKVSNGSGWHAVFMTNGQVYFGHMKSLGSQFSSLTDVYYLQVDQQKELQTDKSNVADQPKLSLIKLGNELHGPRDQMTINRDQILFVEEMKSDSKVVAAIDEYIKNPPATTK